MSRSVASMSARSVVLSVMLGTHPGRMSAAEVVGVGEHVGIAGSTMRVALTRAVASGDLIRSDGLYELSERLKIRQRRQDEGVEDAGAVWSGDWEMAVVVVTGRSGPDRAALRDELTGARLRELREGVWMRPANLRRSRDYASDPVLETFTARHLDGAALAAQLWDLDTWQTEGERFLHDLTRAKKPATRFAAATLVVRHLAEDPLLPAELTPENWPGTRLRQAYRSYQEELRALFEPCRTEEETCPKP